MILRPINRDELSRSLGEAQAREDKVTEIDLRSLNRLLEHKPEDMTCKVEAGMTLRELQVELARRGQWLPVDPPNAERLTIGALLAENASGPRRFGCGTVRDHLIGLTVALADGRLVRSGGNVVKNVAGYDLMKLYIGTSSSLGVIVEATFKLRPLPETERFVEVNCPTLADAERLAEAVLHSELTPIVFDLHNCSSGGHGTLESVEQRSGQPAPARSNVLPLPGGEGRGEGDVTPRPLALVLGFAGTARDIEWQLKRATELGIATPCSLDYARTFASEGGPFRKLAVLPSKTIEAVRGLNGALFMARLGNGVIFHTGADSGPAPVSDGVSRLLRRVKDEFDPKHILPELPL